MPYSFFLASTWKVPTKVLRHFKKKKKKLKYLHGNSEKKMSELMTSQGFSLSSLKPSLKVEVYENTNFHVLFPTRSLCGTFKTPREKITRKLGKYGKYNTRN